MGNVIVLQFITLDGVIEDPDGRSGTPRGGWSFRFGTQAIAGDVFRLGPVLQDGAAVRPANLGALLPPVAGALRPVLGSDERPAQVRRQPPATGP